MSKMNPKVKRQLVAALRSGEYQQIMSGELRIGNRFCVLGVLCNLHAQAHPEIAARQKTKSRYMGQKMTLPAAVAKWAGIYNQVDGKASSGHLGPKVLYMGRKMTLPEHNDKGVSFRSLASIIQEQL